MSTGKDQIRKNKIRKSKNQRTLLWITDPWTTLDHTRDTTLRLAEEAAKLGVRQSWCDVKSIRLNNERVLLDASGFEQIGPSRNSDDFHFEKSQILAPTQFTDLHYRTDPPVDQAYLYPLHLLGLGLRKQRRSAVVNPILALLSANEKTEAAAIQGLMPPSLVSCQWEALRSFGKTLGRTVMKPLNEAQSHGIELLDWRDPDSEQEAKIRLASATQGFSTPIILQQFLEGIAEGETRLWYLDGKLLAYVKKLPIQGDFRVNLDQGSRLTRTTLSRLEKAKSDKISKHLKNCKIRMAAVDLIEGFVTDFNFTSPGLIPQMEDLLCENLAQPIVKALAT